MRGKRRSPRLAIYLLLAIVIVIFVGGRTAVSYWVDLLWFGSLGYASVFWKSFGLEWGTFAVFAALTFVHFARRFFRAAPQPCGRPA